MNALSLTLLGFAATVSLLAAVWYWRVGRKQQAAGIRLTNALLSVKAEEIDREYKDHAEEIAKLGSATERLGAALLFSRERALARAKQPCPIGSAGVDIKPAGK